MNKLRYRIVFNKARGMLMAVQESARSCAKGAGQSGALDSSAPAAMRHPALRRLTLLFGAAFGGFLWAGHVHAQIIADPKASGQQQATVLRAANGVVQVNVQTPSAAGVSRNVYSQFDVSKGGAILNNSRVNVQSELGGWLEANPWMKDGTARVILNEVNSSNPSQLKGFIEVAGQKAEVVIANPSGISVDGSGFINVSRATLTTGVPMLQDGRLVGYDVQRGEIAIDGAGLDASKTDYAALLSRSVRLNAGLWAQRLQVITGINQVAEGESQQVSEVRQASDAPAPKFAIDAGRLGGMYANQIYLVGTERGVGVHNAGEIGAGAGELVVTSEGRLENTGTLTATKNMQLTVREAAENRGKIEVGGDLEVKSASLLNSGKVTASAQVLVAAVGDVDNRGGTIEARRVEMGSAAGALLNADGKILQVGASALAVTVSSADNTDGVLGQAASTGSETGTVTESPGGAAGTIGTGNGAGAGSGSGATEGTGTPESGNGSGNGGTSVAVPAAGALNFASLDNKAGLVTSTGGISLETASLTNLRGQANLRTLKIEGASFDNSNGQVSVQRDAALKVDTMSNQSGRLLVGGAFNAGLGRFDNSKGHVQANSLAVEVGGNMTNDSGTMLHLGASDAVLAVGGKLQQTSGRLETASNLSLRAGEIAGAGSKINVAGDFDLTSGATNAAQGDWRIGGAARMETGTLTISGGAISVTGDLTISADALVNKSGQVATAGSATMRVGGDVDNSAGKLQSSKTMLLDASGNVQNNEGSIETLDKLSALHLQAASIDNGTGSIINAGNGLLELKAGVIDNSGNIGANGAMKVDATEVLNTQDGLIMAVGDVRMDVSAKLQNDGNISNAGSFTLSQAKSVLVNTGDIVAKGALTVHNGAIDNRDGNIATAEGTASRIDIASGSLRNDAGTIRSDGSAAVRIASNVSNVAGYLGVGGKLDLFAGAGIVNDKGRIESREELNLGAATLGNTGGSIVSASAGHSALTVAHYIWNDGVITSDGSLSIATDTMANGGNGIVNAMADLDLRVRSVLHNQGGRISTHGRLSVNEEDAILRNTGTITAEGPARLVVRELDNSDGEIVTGSRSDLSISAGQLTNRNGAIVAGTDAKLDIAGAVDNRSGEIQAGRDVALSAGGALDNSNGLVQASGIDSSLQVQAAEIDNTAGRILNAGSGLSAIRATDHIENSGQIGGNGQLVVSADSLRNQTQGFISSGGDMTLAIVSSLDNAATISSTGALGVNQAGLAMRNSGTVVAGDRIDLVLATLNNDGGKLATSQGSNADVAIDAQSISNQGGAIMADKNATIQSTGDIDNRGGLLQARTDLGLNAGGTLDNNGGTIEALSGASTLDLRAGDLANGTGRIVNVGNAASKIEVTRSLTNQGLIGVNGALDISAVTLDNLAGGSIASAQAMQATVTGSLANAGNITSGGTMQVNADGATVRNSNLIVSQAAMAIRAGDFINDGGQFATAKGSGAALSIEAASISNRSGTILSDAAATVDSAGKLDNTQGTLQAASSLTVDAEGAISNSGGVIEALAANAVLDVHAGSLANGNGRIVNVGTSATSINVDGLLDNSGLVAGNGTMAMSAQDLVNRSGGSIAAAGGSLEMTVGRSMDNAGAISSRTTFDLDAAAAAVRNSGQLVSGTGATLETGAFNNDGGQLVTVKNGGGNLRLDAASISNTGGAMVADGSAAIHAAGDLTNRGGVIEASAVNGALAIQASGIDNSSGRIVNVGSGATTLSASGAVTNSGLIAGNGSLDIAAATLDNASAGTISSGHNQALAISQTLRNSGTISSAGTLTMNQAGALFSNGGRFAAAGAIYIHAANLSNDGGQITTASANGAGITLRSGGTLSNRSGAIGAAGNASLTAGGALDNTQGQVQAMGSLSVSAGGTLDNGSGKLEALGAGATLDVQAGAISNLAGRMVNAGSAQTSITSQSGIVNSGTIAGNGALGMNAQSLQNQVGGTVSAAGALELAVRQQLDNQGGTISSGGRLTFNQAGASFANSGRIASGGEVDIIAASIANDGGQLYTVSGSGRGIELQAGSLSNTGGTVSADGSLDANISGTVGNSGGTLHAGGNLALDASGALNNGSGTIEAAGAASTLTVDAQSISSSGRIVNAGSGKASITSAGDISNSGMIAGNGALDLHARTLQNQAGGQLSSGQAMLLDISQQLNNQGTIGSGGTLTFDEAGATFTNSGNFASKGKAVITAASFTNSGQLSTVDGSGAELAIKANSFTNSGKVVADGSATVTIGGAAINSGGTLQAGADLVLTTSGALQNSGGVIEAIGAASKLTIDSLSIDNGTGRIANTGSGDTRLLSKGAITNAGGIAGMGKLLLSGTTLQNSAAGIIASGQGMDLAITQQLTNQGKVNSGGTLVFNQAAATFTNSGQILSGGNAVITAQTVNNNGGVLGTAGGSGADLTLTSQQLSNQGGRIATDRDLFVATRTVAAMGELFGGRDLALSMDGDYVQTAGAQQFHSNRDLSLTVTGNITNTSTFEAEGKLTLSGNQVTNQAGAVIEAGAVAIKAAGNLSNAGEINGESAVDLVAANISNTNAIVGGSVTVATGNLDNTGAGALIGATGSMTLGVNGTLNNIQGATVYSGSSMTIGGAGGGSTALVNNHSSTIEAGGNLSMHTSSLKNVRENVEIVQVQTVDETTTMTMPSWYKFGRNYDYYDPNSGNYLPFEVYFVNPADILESEKFVTPDGQELTRAVIRTHANDSAFFSAVSGSYSKWGSRSRIPMSEGTKVIYYWDGGTATNPDHGGPSSAAYVRPPDGVIQWNTPEHSYSSAYGSCSTNCIRMVTEPGYTDPAHTIIRSRQKVLKWEHGWLETSRTAHHVAIEDQVKPGAGDAAKILSGGNMNLTVTGTLNNTYGEIRAAGSLNVGGGAAIVNEGATLYRKHTFSGTFTVENGTVTPWTHPDLTEVIGSAAGVMQGGQGVNISGRSFRNVDVTAGTVGNIRDAVNVIGSGTNGAGSAGANATAGGGTGGGAGGNVSGSSLAQGSVAGNVGSSGTGANLASAGQAGNSGLANQLQAHSTASGSGTSNSLDTLDEVQAAGPGRDGWLGHRSETQDRKTALGNVRSAAGDALGKAGAPVQGDGIRGVTKVAPGGLFIRNPDPKGEYLFETRSQFAKEDEWTSSDYLLDKLEADHATTQKRLGDGFYEQRLVREQLSELTGRAPSAGPGDDSLYKQLLNNAASFAQEFGLRPGVSLSADQVSQLTSDIVWLESETVQLPDGSTETVLVPKVYLAHVNADAVKPGGALVTGAGVTIDVSESIMNRGGVIDGGNGRTILLAGGDIANQGGSISGGSVAMQAAGDITNETLAVRNNWSSSVNGGSYTLLSNQASITATGDLLIDAGRNLTDVGGSIAAGKASIFAGGDIGFGTVKTGSTYHSLVAVTTENNSAIYNQLSQVKVGGDLLMSAIGNLNLTGTQVSIGTGGSGIGNLIAGGNVNISAAVDQVKTSLQDDPKGKNYDKRIYENETVVGARVASSGGLLVSAGTGSTGDLNVKGSALAAGGALALQAAGDLNIGSVTENHLTDTATHRESSSFAKKKSSTSTEYSASSLEVGSSVSGGSILATSGRDTVISGSAVVADGDLTIDAKRNLSIVSVEEESQTSTSSQEKKSGFGASYSSGVASVGYSKTSAASQSSLETVTQKASSVGSLNGSVALKSGETLQVLASDIAAKENLSLVAKNIDLAAAQNTSEGQLDTQSKSSGFSVGVTVNPLAAFKDAYKSSTQNSQSNSAIGKSISQAEGVADGLMAATTPVVVQFGSQSSNGSQSHSISEARTSTLNAGKDLTILATEGSITSQGTQISAEGNALILAKDSIKFDVAHNTESQSQNEKSSGFSFDNRSALAAGTFNNKGQGNGITDTVTGTQLSVGGSTTMATQTGDITLTGANVVSEGNLAISAARDLTITSAQDTAQNANQSNNKAIGKVVISDTERFAGYHNEKHLDNSSQVTQVASNVSSLTGNVALTAGDKYTQASSNVLAGNDVTITAKSLDITALDNTGSSQSANSDLKIGAFARVSSPLIDLVNNVEAARKSDGRLQAMQGLAAAANGYQAAQAVAGNGALIKGEVGIGFASSSDSSNSGGSTAVGSTINGGGNVTLTATEGDLHATGATLGAGKTLALDAAQSIVLDASQSTFHTDAKNRSAGAEVGVGYSIGAQTGVYAYAAVNAGKGHSNSDGTINNNTQLKADTITINSNGDTTLKGTVATANTINVDVGGKLAIESVQDTTRNDGSQTNVGARVQVSFGTAWQASGNLSQQKSNGSSTAVGEQSGLFAGDGGYHVKADTVDLKGGAIASTNTTTSELTTNKLTATNLENKMDYSASNVSLAGGIGGKSELARNDNGTVKSLDQQKQLFGTAKDGNVTPGLPMMEKGSDSSTTYATVTDGKITIGGVTTGSVKDLGINADASKAHTALDKLPDLQEVLKNQQAMSAAAGTVLATSKQIIGTIANSASVAASRDQIEAQKVLNDPNSTAEQIAAANLAKADAEKTQAGWAPGGVYSRALNAGVEILVGGMSGQAGGQIAANAMGPTVAKTVGDIGSALQAEAYLDAREFEKQSKQAALNNDPKAAAELAAKAAEADATAANWGDNGLYRVGLHATTQALLGDLANGQSGALAGAAGVVGGNLGQQLAQSLATAEADKLGLIGEKRTAFINAYQQTGAVVGGLVAGVSAAAISNAADGGPLIAAAQGGHAAETVDTFNRQLHPKEIQWIAKNSKSLAATLSEQLGRPVSELEAMVWLTRAGEGNVDKSYQDLNGNSLGPLTSDERIAYNTAKQFISSAATEKYTDESGIEQKLFVAKPKDFLNGAIYSEYRNDKNYRDYMWLVAGDNLRPDNPSSAELAVYNERESERISQGSKDLLVNSIPNVVGFLAAGGFRSRGGVKTAPSTADASAETPSKEAISKEAVSKETVSKEAVSKETASNEAVSNFRVYGLNEIPNQALNVDQLRSGLSKYVKSGNTSDISVAAASITTEDGKVTNLLSVSGKSWKGNAPSVVSINGTTYTVIQTDSGSIGNATGPNGQLNTNHAEMKLGSYINDNFAQVNAKIDIAVQNTSASRPGMCAGCSVTMPNLSIKNPNLKINIYQGSTNSGP
jgi:filamentous hemagglutinin